MSQVNASGALASIGAGMNQITDEQGNTLKLNEKGQVVIPQQDSGYDLFKEYQKQQERLIDERPSAAELNQQALRLSGVEEARRRVNDLNAQIGAIQSQADADVLSMTGQGRGIPEPIILGQQAQIRKEAAIRALPLAATLAAAQDNLGLAEQYYSQFFDILTTDVNNDYKYRSELLKSVYDYADKSEQRKLDAMNEQNTQNINFYNSMVSDIRSAQSDALQNGQSDLAQQFGYLAANLSMAVKDPNSFGNNFVVAQQKFAELTGQMNAKSTRSSTPSVTLGMTEQRSLLGAGLTASEIDMIQNDVNINGINAVLQNPTLTDSQKVAVREAYGSKDTSQFLTKDYLAEYYGDDQLKTNAEQSGYRHWWMPWSTEKDNYLAYLYAQVELKRQAGQTDSEILKGM